ncbi:MAG: hypothetical protein RQ758_06140 [Methanomicrobiaceae archaeon]|nr:hypothetical protein [Methanomicrobiaceae archaeon]
MLLLQLRYKVIWYLAVMLPVLLAGTMPFYGWTFTGIFATFVIGDLFAIPFPVLWGRDAG